MIGRGGRHSSVRRHCFMNLGQTNCVLLSYISGGHWRSEPARRNCHFISAGNGARKWNGFLFLVPICVYVCVRECCDFMSVGRWKIQSQGCFLVLNIPPHDFPARHRTGGTTLMQIQKSNCEWQTINRAAAGVWRYPRALERSDLQCKVERGRSNIKGGRRGWEERGGRR